MALSVSIIVPVYNVESYIKDCFESIVNQTYTGPMECLFIDDCGTDNSVGVLKGLMAEYDGPIIMRLLHHEKNSGLSAARNTGITHSKGEYVFFLDSDDQLFPKTIACLANAAQKESLPDIILGSYQVNPPDNPNNQYQYKYEVFMGQPVIAKAFLREDLFCMAHNKLVRRDFVTDNSLYFKEGIIHEDNLWSFQSFHLAQKVVTIPEQTYYYLIRPGSIMTSLNLERRLQSAKIIKDEVLKDAREGRYELVGDDSLNYLEDLLRIKCGAILNQIYKSEMTSKERVSRIKSFPDDLKPLMRKYLFSGTAFMTMLNFLLRLRQYGLFDAVMKYLYSRNQQG